MKKADYRKFITVSPKVRFGKPVLKGTRVPAELVVAKLAGGMTTRDVAQEYDLNQTQVLAALQYAADLVAKEDIALA